jgi:hypothetical protein
MATIALHTRSNQIYTETMNDIQTVTIHLSREERDRLQSEANRRRLTPDVLAATLLREQLAQVPAPLEALEALTQLRTIAKQMPPIDAVRLAQNSREDLEHRGGF